MVEAEGLGDYIEFRGMVLHFDVPAIYNEADVFVLPSSMKACLTRS
jgi:glycosyltransferase involved in cell wall biosynthesis